MIKLIFILVFLSSFQLLIACKKSSGESGGNANTPTLAQSLTLSTNRLTATQFELIATINNSTESVNSNDFNLSITNATSGAWISTSTANQFKTTISSTVASGEIDYTLTWKSLSKSNTALIFPNIHSRWNQAEKVPGTVNTDGWEDSPEISPDGKYLIISTYSPVSLFQCISDGSLISATSCNETSWSTYSGYRPNFPGASRITSNSVINHNISWLSPSNTTNAFPPVSAYVFERQSSGEYTSGKPIYVDWDAYTWGAPFGLTFRKNISGSTYNLYLAFGDPTLGTGNKLQSLTLDMSGSDLKIGRIYRNAGVLTKTNWSLSPLLISGDTNEAGNPFSTVNGTSNGFLFWDNENASSGQREIFFTTETSGGVFGSRQVTGLANIGYDKYQPYFFQDKLYYSFTHGLILSQEMLSSSDLSLASSWGTAVIELGVDTGHSHSGRLTAIGEPSLYQDSSGKKWMYFAYSISKTGEKLNLNIGRVQSKN